MPPEHKAAGSNPAGRTRVEYHFSLSRSLEFRGFFFSHTYSYLFIPMLNEGHVFEGHKISTKIH